MQYLHYTEVWLTTADRVRLNGWPMPGKHPSGLTLLLLHGNAGNISHRIEKYAIFHELGLDVFAPDYRGYGNNEGEPDEMGLYLDARAAYRYLAELHGGHNDAFLMSAEIYQNALRRFVASLSHNGK